MLLSWEQKCCMLIGTVHTSSGVAPEFGLLHNIIFSDQEQNMLFIFIIKPSIQFIIITMVKVNSTVNGNILTFLDAPRATITMESNNFSMEPASDLLPDK